MFLRNLLPRLCLILIFCAFASLLAHSQQSDASNQAKDEATVEGTVVSSSALTFVVRSDDDQFHLFTWDRNTSRPRSVPAGARVRVDSDQGEQADARHATKVTVLEQAQGTGTARSSSRDAAPVPEPVQSVENQIKRDARRWRLGVRAGVGLDPELVLFGVHSQLGPVFSRNVFFRPNADFEWGEITDMVALNLEAVYRMRTTMRSGEWAPYFGGGPSLNFIHQSFDAQAGGGRNISFGNFDYETGFNILMGVQNRHGTFFEVKTSLYSAPSPVVRLIVGRSF
jgi:hypothetical protein